MPFKSFMVVILSRHAFIWKNKKRLALHVTNKQTNKQIFDRIKRDVFNWDVSQFCRDLHVWPHNNHSLSQSAQEQLWFRFNLV